MIIFIQTYNNHELVPISNILIYILSKLGGFIIVQELN